MAENKVQFNLKNVHYSVLTKTVGTGGTISYSYATPVAIPGGGVNLTLDPAGETTPFYADGVIFYNAISNSGYTGTLEMARVPDAMLKDVWGFTETATGKVLQENSSTEPKEFALLYEIDGDADEQLYVLYDCTAQRPGIGSTTNTASKTPVTQTLSLTAAPRNDGLVFGRTTADTPTATKTGWFSTVYQGDS